VTRGAARSCGSTVDSRPMIIPQLRSHGSPLGSHALFIPACLLQACLLLSVFALSAAPQAAELAHTAKPSSAPARGCLPSGNGYLRARIRGALDLDIDWHNADLECEGGARPGGNGIRLSFAGPPRKDGRRMRLVFGVADSGEGRGGRALPTNVTLILEGEQRLFSTRGDDKCTIDELRQERFGELGGANRSYRVVARGFCTEPASALTGSERIVVSRFDFAGRILFTPQDASEPPHRAQL